MTDYNLPSSEYRVEMKDGSMCPLSVHPWQSLEEELAEIIADGGIKEGQILSIEFEGTFVLEETHPELIE
jgi:hypothetical protein